MPTARLKDSVEEHFTALFAVDARVTVRALRNLETPEPPVSRQDVNYGKAHLFIGFPPTNEQAICLGAAAPWRERGAFMIHVLVVSGALDALATEIAETAKRSLRGALVGGFIDILEIFGSDQGATVGGNWWGESFAVSFEQEEIP